MQQIEVTWVWRTLSPMHCGAGLSSPGYADRLVQADESGTPLIVGDAVKGALRMSAEQVLAWLGYDSAPYQRSSYSGPAEPVHSVLSTLFGGRGRHHFTPGHLVDPTKWKKAVTAATAIDRRSGRALDETLRYIESVAPGAEFRCSCTWWIADRSMLEPSVTLFLAALAATESVGAKVGSGWGRVALAGPPDVSAPGSDFSIDIEAALDPQRLRDLLSSQFIQPTGGQEVRDAESANVSEHAGVGASAACQDPSLQDPVIPVAPALEWWRLSIHLEEPTCVGSSADVANKVTTLDSIPATVLRGALRAAWLRSGVPQQTVDRWIGAATRWTPAQPAQQTGPTMVPGIPIPLSYLRAKDEAGFGSPHGIHDTLSGIDSRGLVDDGVGGEAQHRPVGAGWMTCEVDSARNPLLAQLRGPAQREVRIHVARDYVTGSKRSGALFARESLLPTSEETGFVAYAGLPADVASCWPNEIYIGKRHSAGNGRARLVATRNQNQAGPWPEAWFSSDVLLNSGLSSSDVDDPIDRSTDILVQLLSPAIVLDDRGDLLRTLGAADWERILCISPGLTTAAISGCVRRTATRSIRGWMSTWGHGRGPVTCLQAGSVWRLRCTSAAAATDVRGRLLAAAKRGIGERNHEGFGWVAVDPPWLGHARIAVGSGELPPVGNDVSSSVRPWPGMEGADAIATDLLRSQMIAIVSRLPKALPDELRAPLQEIARRSREASAKRIKQQILPFCDEMAARDRSTNRWRHLGAKSSARRVLETAKGDARLFRFAVEALLIRATGQQEEWS